MPVPKTAAGQAVLRELTDLNKSLKFRIGDFKALADLRKNFAEGARARSQIAAANQGLKEVRQATKETSALYRDLNKRAKEIGATANESKNLWSRLLKRVPGGNLMSKADKFSSDWGAGISLGLLSSVQIAIQLLQKQINESNIKNLDDVMTDIREISTRVINNQIEIKGIDKLIRKIDVRINDVKESVYRAEVNAVNLRQKINDTTYEVRQGRKIVEEKIEAVRLKVNDALYEVRKGRENLELSFKQRVNEVNNLLRDGQRELANKFNEQVKTVSSQVKTVEVKQAQDIKQIKADIKEIEKGNTNAVSSKLAEFQKQINEQGYLSREIRDKIYSEIDKALKVASTADARALNALKNELDKRLSSLYLDQDKLQAQISKNLLSSNTKLIEEKTLALEKNFAASRNALQDTFSNFLDRERLEIKQDIKEQVKEVNKKIDDVSKKQDDVFTNIIRINDRIAAVDQYRKNDTKFLITKINDEIVRVQQNVDGVLKDVDKRVIENIQPTIKKTVTETVTPQIQQLTKESDQLKRQVEKVQPQIDTINTKVKEQEKVNQQALPKLDQILGFLPLIPARAAGLINPNIPTKADLENAAATGTCRTTQPGGCSRKMMDDAVGSVNQHTSNSNANLFDAINTTANGAQIVMLNTINTKLGDQLPGGIGGKLTRFTQWLQLDRALNLLTFAATVHNAAMLSNDIGQTLLGALGNVLQLIGLKDDNGQAFNIGAIISGTIENFIKSIIGAENYTAFTTAWAKANRIYQATTNVLNAFQGLASTMLNALEITAGRVGKIGNALRKGGEVLNNAYSWMNPQPKFNRVTQTLENLQNGASTIQMVTQAPLDVINATTELTNANTEFVKALKEDGKPENKGNDDQEPEQLKATESAAKLVSVSLTLSDLDFEEDE